MNINHLSQNQAFGTIAIAPGIRDKLELCFKTKIKTKEELSELKQKINTCTASPRVELRIYDGGDTFVMDMREQAICPIRNTKNNLFEKFKEALDLAFDITKAGNGPYTPPKKYKKFYEKLQVAFRYQERRDKLTPEEESYICR